VGLERFRPLSLTLTILVGVAIVCWLLYGWLTIERPDRARLISDSAAYADVARSLASQSGYVDRLVTPVQVARLRADPPHPSTYWSPFYPLLVSIGLRLWQGAGAMVPIVVNAIGFLFALVGLYWLGNRLLGRGLGWLPPLVMAMNPRIHELAADGLTEGWFTAFLVGSLLCLLASRRSGRHLMVAGILLALAQLTRPNAFLLLPVFAALALRRPATMEAATTEGVATEAAATPAVGNARSGPVARSGVLSAGPMGLLIMIGFFVMTLLPWIVFRYDLFGSPFFELQRFNLLSNLGPWSGSNAFRSLYTPAPLAYILQNPFEFAGKLIVGGVKSCALLPCSFLAPVEFALVCIGAVAMLRDRWQRLAIQAILALVLLQLLIGAATLLDPRIWQPVGVLLWIPLAAGLGVVARRLIPTWPEVALATLAMVVVVLPFGQVCLQRYLQPDLGRARWTEEEVRTLGDWVGHMVPAGETLLTDFEELVWYADRKVVWQPLEPSETGPLRALTGLRHVAWQAAGGHGGDEAWRRHFDQEIAAGRLLRLGEMRLESGVFVVGRWE